MTVTASLKTVALTPIALLNIASAKLLYAIGWLLALPGLSIGETTMEQAERVREETYTTLPVLG